MRFAFAFMLLLLIAHPASAAVHRTGLKEALDKGLIRVTARSTGEAYYEKALRLDLVNQTGKALQIEVEPALVFRPDDTSYQDLILPGEEMLTLAPGAAAGLRVQTFCAKAGASAPAADLEYAFMRQSGPGLIRLLDYLKQQRLFNELGQHAVWALTDGHSLENIIDPARPKTSSDLLALVVSLTGGEIPPYFKHYKLSTAAGRPVFEKRILKIIVKLDWKLEAPAAISLGIFNEAGREVQNILRNQEMQRGGYRMQVEFEAEGAPPGKYYLRLKEGESLKQEMMVKVD